MREGAAGAAGGSEAAGGELAPARRWPTVTPRPAAPLWTRVWRQRGRTHALRAMYARIGKKTM